VSHGAGLHVVRNKQLSAPAMLTRVKNTLNITSPGRVPLSPLRGCVNFLSGLTAAACMCHLLCRLSIKCQRYSKCNLLPSLHLYARWRRISNRILGIHLNKIYFSYVLLPIRTALDFHGCKYLNCWLTLRLKR